MRLETDAAAGNNEVEQFINSRYISASESVWKLLGFPITGRSHSVQKLACHLPDQQSLCYEKGNERSALERGQLHTTLTAWFEVNKLSEKARGLLYPNFPEQYVFNDHQWTERKRGIGKTVGRVPSVPLNPRSMETYCLRLILHNKAGATSYNDLLRVDGVDHPTFQAAAAAMGLVEDDAELDKAMEEASSIQFGNQIRRLFLSILLYCRPSDPLKFWLDHKQKLYEDWVRNDTQESAENRTLIWLETQLRPIEMDLASFGLPQPVTTTTLISKELAVIAEETNYDTEEQEEKYRQRLQLLNDEQKQFFQAVKEGIDGEGGMFIVDAPGGTGKTYVLDCLLSYVRSKGGIAVATALSAVASKLLDGGRTLHSKLKLPINIQEDSLCKFNKNTAVGKMMIRAELIIIDEVSMGHKHNYEAIDRSLREVREVDKPFGGLCTVFSGDWRQTLPVIPQGSESQIVDACLKFSYLWEFITVFHLTENMRVKLSGSPRMEEFSQWLLTIGDGTCGEGELTIPEEMKTTEDSLESLIDSTFEDVDNNYKDSKWLAERAVLCPTNTEADEVNNFMVEKFHGEKIEFKSIDTTEENSPDYTPEFLNTCSLPGIAPHLLRLKLGLSVILLRTMNHELGHCNGVKYVVTNIKPHILELRSISGTNVGSIILLPRIVMISQSPALPFTLRRKQFPIRLCFGMTANR